MNASKKLIALAALALTACGGAAPAAMAPAKSAAPDTTAPQTIEEAQAQIASASAQLNGGASADTAKKSTTPAAPPTPPTEAPKATDPSSTAGGLSACVDPCRALASMRRAVDALCRMTGDTDNRCVDAKKTLTDSVTRTASCTCSG